MSLTSRREDRCQRHSVTMTPLADTVDLERERKRAKAARRRALEGEGREARCTLQLLAASGKTNLSDERGAVVTQALHARVVSFPVPISGPAAARQRRILIMRWRRGSRRSVAIGEDSHVASQLVNNPEVCRAVATHARAKRMAIRKRRAVGGEAEKLSKAVGKSRNLLTP